MTGQHFDSLPYEEGRRWELIEGELMEVSSPTPRHQMIVLNILGALHQYLGNTSGVLFHGLEFALSDLLRLRPEDWIATALPCPALRTSPSK